MSDASAGKILIIDDDGPYSAYTISLRDQAQQHRLSSPTMRRGKKQLAQTTQK